MELKKNERFLSRLNREVIFCMFEDASWHNDAFDSAEALYFDVLIRVWLPNATRPDPKDEECFTGFAVELRNLEDRRIRMIESEAGDHQMDSIAEAIRLINAYLQSRPFTICWHGRGKYTLLDPNGFDYIGEYVTLAEARKSCDQNFRMEGV